MGFNVVHIFFEDTEHKLEKNTTQFGRGTIVTTKVKLKKTRLKPH